MARTKKQIINQTVEQLQVEANKKGGCKVTECGQIIHCVDPIPDNDWNGETWGLYFSDYEDELMALIEQDPGRYIKKHPEDKYRPRSHGVRILECPVTKRSPSPTPPPPPKPAPVLDIRPPAEIESTPVLAVATLGSLPNFDKSSYHSPDQYRNLHKESVKERYLRAHVSHVTCISCPAPKKKVIAPPPPPELPNIKLRDNALHPGLPTVLELEDDLIISQDGVDDNKWGWMKQSDRSVGMAKYRLSMFW